MQWTPIITLALFFEKHGIGEILSQIKQKITQSSHDRQIQDEQESRDMQILKFCDEVGIELGENEGEIKGNKLGWIPTEVFYRHLIPEDVAPKYGINPEFFSRSKFTQTLRRLGFKSDKKKGGISWLITRKEVEDVKERMGMTEPKQETPDNSSISSKSSIDSTLDTNTTNKSELNEVNAANEADTIHPKQEQK